MFLTKKSKDLPTNYFGQIPERIVKMLWFSDWRAKNYEPEIEKLGSFKINDIEFSINAKITPDEPSAISVTLPISATNKCIDEFKLGYYPSYVSLSPKERWIYINWLKDISNKIDIGFVFIFYYGLERHLFLGDFENAFDLILELRKHHKNHSFLDYSTNALISSSILRDKNKHLSTLIEKNCFNDENISDLFLFAKKILNSDLMPGEIIRLSNNVKFKNKRYIKNEYDLFKVSLNKILEDKYQDHKLSLTNFSLEDCPKGYVFFASNFSLDDKIRGREIPCLCKNEDFINTITNLLQESHDVTKISLKNNKNK